MVNRKTVNFRRHRRLRRQRKARFEHRHTSWFFFDCWNLTLTHEPFRLSNVGIRNLYPIFPHIVGRYAPRKHRYCRHEPKLRLYLDRHVSLIRSLRFFTSFKRHIERLFKSVFKRFISFKLEPFIGQLTQREWLLRRFRQLTRHRWLLRRVKPQLRRLSLRRPTLTNIDTDYPLLNQEQEWLIRFFIAMLNYLRYQTLISHKLV